MSHLDSLKEVPNHSWGGFESYDEKREFSASDNSTQSESRDSCEDTLSDISSMNAKRPPATHCPIYERLHQLSLDKHLDGKKKRSAIQKAREEREAHRNGEMMKHTGTIPLSQASKFYDRCMQNKLEREKRIARAEDEKKAKEKQSMMGEGRTIPLEQATRLHYINIGNPKAEKDKSVSDAEEGGKANKFERRSIPLKQITRLHYMGIGNHRRKKSVNE